MDEKVKMRVSPEFSSTPVLKTGDGRQDAAVGCELDGPLLGIADGAEVGGGIGFFEGMVLGIDDGAKVILGLILGPKEGKEDGGLLGNTDETKLGNADGFFDGNADGFLTVLCSECWMGHSRAALTDDCWALPMACWTA